MKRFFAIALVAVFVLGMAATAMAAHLEVTGDGAGLRFTGEFRARGIAQNNTSDASDDALDHKNWIDQRYRLMLDALVGDDVEVKTRFTAGSGAWDGAATGDGIVTDHAYLQMKAFDSTFYIGRQPASWGNKLLVWGAIKDRAKIVRKAGDITYGAIYQKDSENYSAGGGGDTSEFAGFVVVPAGDHKVSVIVIHVQRHSGEENTGMVADVSYNGKAGPVGLAAEFATKTGDLFAGANDDNAPTGFFVAGNMNVSDALNVAVAYAMAMNTFKADDDFAPVLAVGGAVNPTAFTEFGALQQAADDTASAIVLMASYKASDALSAGVNVAMHNFSDEAELKGTEIDVHATYNLATNTNLWLGYAYIMPDGFSDDDNPITSAAWQIKTTF